MNGIQKQTKIMQHFLKKICHKSPCYLNVSRPQQAVRAQGGSGWVKAPDFLDVLHYEGGRSSASCTSRLHPQGKSLVLIFRG
jgi:hypothetical protein